MRTDLAFSKFAVGDEDLALIKSKAHEQVEAGDRGGTCSRGNQSVRLCEKCASVMMCADLAAPSRIPPTVMPPPVPLLDECNLPPNAVVLDVATGPGTVARVAAKRVGPGGRVVAADISRPILDVANSKPSSPDPAPITYIESPAAPLGGRS
jgi:SAM-dependent methyltransferase